jgi:hypothetical protein
MEANYRKLRHLHVTYVCTHASIKVKHAKATTSLEAIHLQHSQPSSEQKISGGSRILITGYERKRYSSSTLYIYDLEN